MFLSDSRAKPSDSTPVKGDDRKRLRHDERCGGTYGRIYKLSNITINQFYNHFLSQFSSQKWQIYSNKQNISYFKLALYIFKLAFAPLLDKIVCEPRAKTGVCALYEVENPSASLRGSTFYAVRKSPLSLSEHNILLQRNNQLVISQ